MGYLIVGLVWCCWLEWYTTKELAATWVWAERFFHTLLWPVSLSVFVYNFFKGL